MSTRSLLWFLSPVVLGWSVAAADQPTFTGLGDTPAGEPVFSIGQAISADGLVVTGRCTPSGAQRTFRWTTSGGMVNLGGPNFAIGTGTSADGSVLVCNGATGAGDSVAYRWTTSGFASYLGLTTSSPGPRVFAVSADGSVAAGESNTPFVSTAVRWPATGTAIALSNEPGFTSSSSRGISADGTIIVGLGSGPGMPLSAFRWTLAAGASVLMGLSSGQSAANAISPDGAAIVGYSTSASGQEACIWIGGTPTGLGDLPDGAFTSTALAASTGGTTIVGYGTSATGQEAIIWDATHGLRSLHDELLSKGVTTVTGWTLTQASGISADGLTIVGYGTNPDGRTEGWIAHFPAPAAPCYANCDGSTANPILNVLDFACFLTSYAAGASYANCDGSTAEPVLNVVDFMCFLNKYAAGCT